MARSQNLNNEIRNSETIPLDGNIAKTKVVKNIEIADDLTKIVTVKNKIISDPEKCSVIDIKEVSKILCAVSDCADDGNNVALVDGLTRPNVIEDTLLSSPKSKAYNNHVRCPPVSTGGTYSSDENTNTDTDELLHFESDVTLCSNFHIPHNIDQSNSKLKFNIDKNSLHKENTQHSREFLLLKEDFRSKTIQCKEAYRYETLHLF